jgi:hypothetical protein
MIHKKTGNNYRKRLVFLALIGMLMLSVQVCSGFINQYEYVLDVTVQPSSVEVGSPATITIHASDPYHPDKKFAYAQGSIYTWQPNNSGVWDREYLYMMDATGTYTRSFTPTVTGNYRFSVGGRYNYSTFGPPFQDVGILLAQFHSCYLTSNPKFTVVPQVVQVQPFIIPNGTSTPQVTTTQVTTPQVTTTQPTTTQVTQPVADQVITTLPVTAAQTSANSPSSVSDSMAPVTTLNTAGTADGSGGFTSDVTCTLTAADNDGGSGVNVIQYSFDGSSWFTFTKPFSIIKPGMTTVYYRSTDNAGNTEVAKVKAILISGPGASSTEPPAQPAATPAAPSLPANATPAKATPWLSGEITICTILTVAAALIYKKAVR